MRKKVYVNSIEQLKSIFHKVSFFIFKKFPINNKKIVFITLHSNTFTGNNKLIYEELIKRDLDLAYRLYGMEDIKLSNLNVFEKFIKSIIIDYNICTARYVILNDFYSLFTMIKLREETDLIQVWHAGGAFKKFGRDSLRNIEKKDILKKNIKGHSQYTKMIVSSQEVVEIYSNALGIPQTKIYPIGIPRADIFFNNNSMMQIKTALFNKYLHLLNKKIILYAPTFRDDKRNNNLLELDLNYMIKSLGQDYIVILKMHPFERGKIRIDEELSSKVFDLSHEEINDLLIITDILITDYSSLIFEYTILQKPVIFFAYDLEKYENNLRGFYYNYVDFVPGPIAYSTEEIVEYINDDKWDLERVKEFAIKFNGYFDGDATERFINDVLFEE